MKNNTDIDHIRILLHKYYEAETSPEEELLLESFFIDTPEDEIPDDLAEDRRLFNSMGELHTEISGLEIQEDLLDRISIFTSTSLPSSPSGYFEKSRTRSLGYTVAAASACLMLYIGYQNYHSDDDSQGGAAITENAQLSNRLDDGFIEITDPEEAEKIMTEIATLLAANTKQSNEAIRHLERTLGEYKELNKSRLQ